MHRQPLAVCAETRRSLDQKQSIGFAGGFAFRDFSALQPSARAVKGRERPMLSKPALLSVAFILNPSLPLQAHDIYSHLVDETGKSCCDNRDCRPAHYRIKGGSVQMFIYGNWLVIPHAKIQYRTIEGDSGETAGGHWCGQGHQGRTYIIYVTRCAILPPQAASSQINWPGVSGE